MSRLAQSRCRFLLAFSALLVIPWPVGVSGTPYVMLYGGAAKCFQVEAPRQTAIEIHYQAPDLVLEDDPPEAKTVRHHVTSTSLQAEGIDSRFNERQRQQHNLAVRKIKDTNILVYQEPSVGALGRIHPGVGGGSLDLKGGTGRIRHQLDARQGVVEFQTHSRENTPVEICVQSYSSSPVAPARISLHVRRKSDRPGGAADVAAEEDVKKLSLLSNIISADLIKFEQRTRELGGNADQARDQEKDFHGISVKLNSAVKYWPIFRMVILLVGGYSQVTHVVRYMKSRHIY